MTLQLLSSLTPITSADKAIASYQKLENEISHAVNHCSSYDLAAIAIIPYYLNWHLSVLTLQMTIQTVFTASTSTDTSRSFFVFLWHFFKVFKVLATAVFSFQYFEYYNKTINCLFCGSVMIIGTKCKKKSFSAHLWALLCTQRCFPFLISIYYWNCGKIISSFLVEIELFPKYSDHSWSWWAPLLFGWHCISIIRPIVL